MIDATLVNKISTEEECLADVAEGRPQSFIRFNMLPKDGGYGFLDDLWEEDDDGIAIDVHARDVVSGAPLITAEFPTGVSAQAVARVLRKWVAMLEGEHGPKLVKMGPSDQEYSDAVRLEDGDMFFYNMRVEIEEYQKRLEAGVTGDELFAYTGKLRDPAPTTSRRSAKLSIPLNRRH